MKIKNMQRKPFKKLVQNIKINLISLTFSGSGCAYPGRSLIL